jgi:RNA recognition motif-containing protein
MNIYVSNLSFNVQNEDLRDFFTPFGEVTSVNIINDRTTGQSRGFGFVEMSDDVAANKAVQELDGGIVEGRSIRVSEAKPKEDRPARSSSSPFRSDSGGSYKKKY